MSYVVMVAKDVDGNEVSMRHEAPKDEQGRTAVGLLMASGKTYENPLYAIGSRRDAHLGIDGKGSEGVPDQRWVFDLAEAGELAASAPDRFLRVQG